MEKYEFMNGHWEWNDSEGELEFISHDEKETPQAKLKTTKAEFEKFSGCTHTDLAIQFRHEVSLLDKIRFQRHFQRHVKPSEPEVVTIRDIKDVVLYNVINPLPVEFIYFFHTANIDKFLRALIIYFQLLNETYDELMERREMEITKVRHPHSSKVEQKMREDLNILRAMLAREYCAVLLGNDHLHKFHHMANKQHISAGEKDIRLWELLYRISIYVVWIAHHRRHFPLIELEVNRLFRTDTFNPIAYNQHQSSSVAYTGNESSILCGDTGKDDYALFKHTPLYDELASQKHDYRMLGIGIINFSSQDPRIIFFEKLYCCPEEEFQELGLRAGILGLPRDNFDAMLVDKKEEEEEVVEDKKRQITSFSQPRQIPRASKQEQQLPHIKFTFPGMGDKEDLPISFPSKLDLQHDPHEHDRTFALNMWVAHK